MSGALAKPQLRGLHVATIKKSFIGVVLVPVVVTILYKHFVCDARVKQYAEFYKTYDPEAKLKIMVDAGLMEATPEKAR